MDEAENRPFHGHCPWTSTDVQSPTIGLSVPRGLPSFPAICLQTVSMPDILVRDLPDAVHRALAHRAEHRGQSLQQYLASELTRLAQRPSPDELFARISKRRGGTVGLAQAVADLDAERSAS
jgi:hypothetical protein